MEVGSSSLPGTTHRRRQCDQVTMSPGTTHHPFGGLAQLARAPALQAGGQRFESVILHLGRKINRVGLEIFDILTHKTVSNERLCF